jgi:hypothetical protein
MAFISPGQSFPFIAFINFFHDRCAIQLNHQLLPAATIKGWDANDTSAEPELVLKFHPY